MPYPKKKNLTLDMDHNVRVLPKEKSKYKAPPKSDYNDIGKKYMFERDMDWLADPNWPEEDKIKIRERWKDRNTE